jgi:hypothetical protein
MNKLDQVTASLAYLFNRGAGTGISADGHLWIIAERLFYAYPTKVQHAVLVHLLAKDAQGNDNLSPKARERLVGYLTDEVNVWGDD